MTTKKRVLIIEDSEIDRNTLEAALTHKGYEVTALADGHDCLDKIKTAHPDVVLLDILLPEIEGTELLKQIRKHYNPIELPVLMITIKSESADIVESLSLGANDFLSKPIDFDVAATRINTHLTLSELSQSLVKLKEVETLNALIGTYNHEINNPLSVAITTLDKMDTDSLPSPLAGEFKRLETCLWKIADIVKKIGEVSKKEAIEYKGYTQSAKTIKIK